MEYHILSLRSADLRAALCRLRLRRSASGITAAFTRTGFLPAFAGTELLTTWAHRGRKSFARAGFPKGTELPVPGKAGLGSGGRKRKLVTAGGNASRRGRPSSALRPVGSTIYCRFAPQASELHCAVCDSGFPPAELPRLSHGRGFCPLFQAPNPVFKTVTPRAKGVFAKNYGEFFKNCKLSVVFAKNTVKM